MHLIVVIGEKCINKVDFAIKQGVGGVADVSQVLVVVVVIVAFPYDVGAANEGRENRRPVR